MDEYREFTDKEVKWLKSLQRVMSKAPSTLLMFVGNGIAVYPLDKNGDRYLTGSGAVDDGAPSESISTPMHTDGGDY